MGELLTPLQLISIHTTVAGIAWVVFVERSNSCKKKPQLCTGGAVCLFRGLYPGCGNGTGKGRHCQRCSSYLCKRSPHQCRLDRHYYFCRRPRSLDKRFPKDGRSKSPPADSRRSSGGSGTRDYFNPVRFSVGTSGSSNNAHADFTYSAAADRTLCLQKAPAPGSHCGHLLGNWRGSPPVYCSLTVCLALTVFFIVSFSIASIRTCLIT